MKKENGMGIISLIICIIIIAGLAVLGVKVFTQANEDRIINNRMTDMQLLQGKVKVIAQEHIVKKDERPLVGKKLADNEEDEIVKRLIETEIIKKDEEKFNDYYIIDGEALNSLELYNNLEGEYYIVNYSTYEIIYSNGIEVNGNMMYKLTDLLKYRDEKEKAEEDTETTNITISTNEEKVEEKAEETTAEQ